MADINYESSILKDSSRPQTGAHLSASESINNLNSHEQAKMKRILEQDYSQRQPTILDMPLGKDTCSGSNDLNSRLNSFMNFWVDNSPSFRIMSNI